jgi:integrase
VFTTPSGAPIDQVNFYAREWVPMLQRLGVRLRPFYNTRHTYITYLLSLGVSPLFVARQTGASLEMIEAHYGGITAVANELDVLIRGREENETGNLSGPPP